MCPTVTQQLLWDLVPPGEIGVLSIGYPWIHDPCLAESHVSCINDSGALPETEVSMLRAGGKRLKIDSKSFQSCLGISAGDWDVGRDGVRVGEIPELLFCWKLDFEIRRRWEPQPHLP